MSRKKVTKNYLIDLSYYAQSNIPNYTTITKMSKEKLDYLNSGLRTNNMKCMFDSCYELTSIPKLNIDTSQCIDMNNMFYDCSSITSLDLTNFNTSKVTNMFSMFFRCNKLTSLDLSNFDTSKVTNMRYMFYDCASLTTIKGVIDMKSCTINYDSMFYNCTKLKGVQIKNPPSGFDGAGLNKDQYTIVG